MSKKDLSVIVHNVRSLHNVGSVFRTADGAGVSKIYLTGYTPSPLDEMGRARKEISKTALGAEESVKWEVIRNITTLIKWLKKSGVQIIALENTKNAVDYRRFKPIREQAVLIIGNEVRGLSPALLKKCDVIISIPMRGRKESLNVSVAFGIAVYTLTI
ncbi:MAG: TrmH family RNA methyltransferase [Patescibacteria group bacterium]